jgi:hypothetical protein
MAITVDDHSLLARIDDPVSPKGRPGPGDDGDNNSTNPGYWIFAIGIVFLTFILVTDAARRPANTPAYDCNALPTLDVTPPCQ